MCLCVRCMHVPVPVPVRVHARMCVRKCSNVWRTICIYACSLLRVCASMHARILPGGCGLAGTPVVTRCGAMQEVLAIQADPDCVQGSLVAAPDATETWIRPLHDGSFAVVLLNKVACRCPSLARSRTHT